ncbi:5'-3' exoribonuclease 1 [Wickerhamomyces ciferrii]|uniref:5'-3' exoribonuclease 1 n=1 Tax=Wickerhamomyces ciferrii (strain ATCC 14091 / BCRC 22168 / CBS 111 / JCM 3599 / NBRC 0793 / NRRL Y-1031 F-60-10) TaxID=1206466 RepID=K0KWY3_WICCF|nr:5'-3' exoribonuclease 1 [Wickerhamomyces ciferrii]CCH46557.1 5'-3' exoribonuclease 1 [Wickerhamomyces ciferrii]
MAIPYFYSMLKENDSECFKNGGKQCDNLYIDMNCIFHICLRDAKSEKDFKDLILAHLQMVTAAYCPHKLLYIAIDGVPPLGKLKGQALRRQSYIKSGNGIDPNALTPGTEFMNMLSQFITKCTGSHLPKLSSNVKVIISDSNVPGEGEFKIVNHIREQDIDMKVVIYGIDADLIALSLSLKQRQVFLARQKYKRGVTTSRSRQCEYLIVSSLKNKFLEPYSNEQKSSLNTTNILKDIVLLLILLGNDFLPKPEGLYVNSDTYYELSWFLQRFHREENKTIIKDNRIDTDVFTKFLKKFIEFDFQTFDESTIMDQKVIDEKIISIKLAGISISNTEKDEEENVKKLAQMECFEEHKKKVYEQNLCEKYDELELIKQYYKGLHWVLRYYLGKCPSYDYVYPYDNAPFLSDLVKVNQDVEFVNTEPINALHQLALVIPKKSSILLPSRYKESELYDQFSTVLTTSKPLLNTEINKWIKYFQEIDSQANVIVQNV